MDTGPLETEQTDTENNPTVSGQGSEEGPILTGQEASEIIEMENETSNITDTGELCQVDQSEEVQNDYIIVDSEDVADDDDDVVELHLDEGTEKISESRNKPPQQRPQHDVPETPMKTMENSSMEILNESPQQDPPQRNNVPENPSKLVGHISGNRLGGAAKKRFRFMLAHGVPVEEARVKCFKTTMESLRNSLGESSQQTVKAASSASKAAVEPKKSKVGAAIRPEAAVKPKKSTVAAAAGEPKKSKVDAAVMPVDYPLTMMSRQQLENIQEIVLEKIVSCKGSNIKPKFLGTQCRSGWLSLTCADTPTFEWLKSITDELNPFEGTTLKCVNKSQVPGSVSFEALLQGSEDYDDSKILSFIESQNEKLSTSKWRIVRRVKTDLKNKIMATFYVDFESEKVLKDMGFKVNYKFGQTEFVKTGKSKNTPNVAQRTQSSKQKTSPTKPAPSNQPAKAKPNVSKTVQPTKSPRNNRLNNRNNKMRQSFNTNQKKNTSVSVRSDLFAQQPLSKKARNRRYDRVSYNRNDHSSRDQFNSGFRGRDRSNYESCSSHSNSDISCTGHGIRSLLDIKPNSLFQSSFGIAHNNSTLDFKRKHDGAFESFHTPNKKYAFNPWSSDILSSSGKFM